MEKVMQPKKMLKLTDAEKKVILAYSVHAKDNDLKQISTVAPERKLIM